MNFILFIVDGVSYLVKVWFLALKCVFWELGCYSKVLYIWEDWDGWWGGGGGGGGFEFVKSWYYRIIREMNFFYS